MFDVNHPEVIDAVRRALAEDIGSGDVTTLATVPGAARARAASSLSGYSATILRRKASRSGERFRLCAASAQRSSMGAA